MSQTRTAPGNNPDSDVAMKENDAAAALVGVAAGLVSKASDSASSSGGVGILPTNNASRKQWDREQAAPVIDGMQSQTSTATPNNSNNDANTSSSIPAPAPASQPTTTPTVIAAAAASATTNATTTSTDAYAATAQPQYQPPPLTSYHAPTGEHRAAAAPTQPQQHHPQAVPQTRVHAQGTRRLQPPPQPTVAAVGSTRPEPGRWPGTVHAATPPHQAPPPGYPVHPHAAHHHAHAVAAHVAHHHAAHHAHAAAAAAAAHAHAAHHNRHQQQQQARPPPPQLQQQQPHHATSVLMSMSSIGFGVAPASATDATEAVIRAVQDSMERSAVRLPTSAALRQSLTIHLKLGVPPKPTGEPMHVDMSRLSLFLPQSVPLLPVQVVIGGLLIDQKEVEEATMHPSGGAIAHGQQPTICTAVACVTLQQSTPEVIEQAQNRAAVASGMPSTMAVRAPHAGATPWAQIEQQQAPQTHGAPPPPPPFQPHHAHQQPLHQHQHHTALTPQASSNGAVNLTGAPNPSPKVHRTNSMEVLAQISGEIRERQMSASSNGGTHEIPHAAATLAMVCSNEAANLEFEHRDSVGSRGSLSIDNNNAYSYKKLAPGMTPKGTKRLFVRHDYKDYSRDEPQPEEQFLARSEGRTPNAAFPLKLHETLAQIEEDGFGHIIGWMPHGRSFKIHQQQEFVDVVLPRYFVMTKKSSFLRQLNLYNFNRISVGPDSGSYYHEKFLRGLKFLCRRMSRQKVNGNGIRAAGNPDDEPALANFPSCPPKEGSASCDSSRGSQHEGDNQNHDARNAGVMPYSRLVGGPASQPYSQVVQSSIQSNGMTTPGNREATLFSHEMPKHDSNATTKESLTRLNRAENVASSHASFPLKLQRILDKADVEGKTDIISWLPHGRVHDVDRFVSEVMTQHFNQTKYSSFQRQLHMYNFQRITFGRDKGAYHHEKFHRGRPDLCMAMVRTRVNGKGCRRPGDPDNEPDFYVDWEPADDSPCPSTDGQPEQEGGPAVEPV